MSRHEWAPILAIPIRVALPARRPSAVKRLVKTLRFIQHTVGACHATVELGDRWPSGVAEPTAGVHRLVQDLGPGVRLILFFEGEVPGHAKEKLGLLVDSLDDVARGARRAASVFPMPRAQRELSLRLLELAESSGAVRAVVLDGTSPVLFGDSHDDQARLDVEDALHAVRLSRRVSEVPGDVARALQSGEAGALAETVENPLAGRLTAREWHQLALMAEAPADVALASQLQLHHAIAALREDDREQDRCAAMDGPVPFLARRFASIYWVLLVFHEPFNELVADGHLVKALDAIERLVISLPPLDPDDPAKVRRFKPV